MRQTLGAVKAHPIFIFLVIGFFALILNYRLQRPKVTAEEKACKEAVMSEYWATQTPLLREAASVNSVKGKNTDRLISETNRIGNQSKELDRKYLSKWWSCHIQHMPEEYKAKLEKEGRWQEYQNLVVSLSDILDRYIMVDAADILSTYGRSKTADEIRALHKK